MSKEFYKNPYFITIVSIIALIILGLTIYFLVVKKSGGGKTGGGGGKTGGGGQVTPVSSSLSLAGNNGKISCWAWNSRVTGGFMGYGIFANKTGGYTWNSDGKAVSNDDNKSKKWDEQLQNSQATGIINNLDNYDSGSQFWDLISKNGSYKSTYDRSSLDGIKIQYDSESASNMDMSERYKNLLNNLSQELSNIGILIGGKPKDKETAYHGTSYANMKKQISNAVNWITDNNLGDKIYISLDIEPADSLLDNTSMVDDQGWYDLIFNDLAEFITKIGTNKPNVYFGMAINKNPYQTPKAYKAWSNLMRSNWKTADNKERGFRVIELMYWWTYTDTKINTSLSHLRSQLLTKGPEVNSNPVVDAVNNGCYLQFGLELTGEVDYLIFVDKPADTSTPVDCGALTKPIPDKNCYRAQNGVNIESDGIGYVCKSKNTNPNSFYNYGLNDTNDQYFSAMKKVGKKDDYYIVYGFPYIGYCGNSKNYPLHPCNALGGCTRPKDPDADPNPAPGNPQPIASAVNFKSCTYLNKETWLLGGGLSDTSIEEYLHSNDAVSFLRSIITGIDSRSADRIFSIPFCLEDFSGYSGWLHNFKYGANCNDSTKINSLADFPDNKINDNGEGKICRSDFIGKTFSDEEYVNKYGKNIACLGQTTMSVDNNNKITDWTAGTLNYDETAKTWSCPTDKYFHV